MEDQQYAEPVPQRCEQCLHFQAREYTGYCQLHHMYVLRAFGCARFVQDTAAAVETPRAPPAPV